MPNSKVIFLDIDGVLNSLPYANNHPDEELNPENLKRLAEIQHKTDAAIVLSSTWKDCDHPDEPDVYYMYENLINTLKIYGLSIQDKTPDTHKGRPHEIHTYLEQHPKTNTFVILDDDYTPEDYAAFGIASHLVQTKFFCHTESEGGLQDYHVKQAIQILNPSERRNS